ncbi:unnamed protein product [Vitrella brassicaformis CCMP3155]|uniref:PPM-type phosphatase domain-containing protein n=1 Tax=Vitrella brassicaformis (strain CCMP3155) TaxID=1169540 RepID=A0A0G4EH71_VITBC|nr:unnamed protein product [Vitrella brassicaformis CCMP3155]|mmetsp:Transcript_6694/g.16211  ORF Transcript_6694/g.16211 Transcript_6694/m.16211 type:complete len:285 (+) Transcript_6694:69-923(+)|eukprot:CEL95824.1 unnamed protein product [Vitrella brassicaformis CCMP3155]
MGYTSKCDAVKCVGWAEDQGTRAEMEDGWVFVDCFGGRKKSAFIGMYDGHGGREAVEFVTTHLHDKVLEELRKPAAEPRAALISAFIATDDNMLQDAGVSAGVKSSGATACVCLVQEEKGVRKVYTAHLGDARAVLNRGGKAHRLTSMSDHKATDPEEAKRVIQAGGYVFNERVQGMLAISRAFGDHQLKAPEREKSLVSNVPDVTAEVVVKGDMFMIVACDGLWDVIDDQTACNLVMEGLEELKKVLPNLDIRMMSEIVSRMLVEEALVRGTSDNVTVLVVFL